MSLFRLVSLTVMAMLAFAGNALLCRIALSTTHIDPASFTSIRLLSGALTLYILVWLRQHSSGVAGNWRSALALFGYATCFSFAYIDLSAATGALLLFGAVQCTMIGYGLASGERTNSRQTLGVMLALTGLIGLLLPGLAAPPLLSAGLMLSAGICWGVYSLRGRGVGDATRETAGNFVRAAPLALLVSLLTLHDTSLDSAGVVLAMSSGSLASGVGYAIWYSVLPSLRATTAATVQLTVPALAALGGVLFLSEPVTLRLALASAAILGGVALYILSKPGRPL